MDFGLTERFSKKVYFQCVPKRTRAVLLKIIEERVEKIESIWRVAKRKFKSMGGVDRKYLDSYLTEFISAFEI